MAFAMLDSEFHEEVDVRYKMLQEFDEQVVEWLDSLDALKAKLRSTSMPVGAAGAAGRCR